MSLIVCLSVFLICVWLFSVWELFIPSVCLSVCLWDRRVGLVVKASASRAADLGSIPIPLAPWTFPQLSHTSDFKTCAQVATLPGAGYYRVSAWTGWHGVSILWLSETKKKKKQQQQQQQQQQKDLQLLSQCGSTCTCLSRYIPEMHQHVAGTWSNQQTTKSVFWLRSLPLLLLPTVPLLPGDPLKFEIAWKQYKGHPATPRPISNISFNRAHVCMCVCSRMWVRVCGCA